MKALSHIPVPDEDLIDSVPLQRIAAQGYLPVRYDQHQSHPYDRAYLKKSLHFYCMAAAG